MDTNENLHRQPKIPYSNATVDVFIVDTTTRMGKPSGPSYLDPADHYPALLARGDPSPSYSFLIVHVPSDTKLLFDLGLRVDWKTASSPAIVRWVQEVDIHVSVEKDVATILLEGGVDPKEIDAVVFSHQHFDHTGDTARFSEKMKVIVGPGYRNSFLPGWPENKRSWDTTSDLYRGRQVVEVAFTPVNGDESRLLKIGGFEAYDYFGDGSFYLLNTPGHTVAHVSALARTTAPVPGSGEAGVGQPTFILLGGDVAHNCALFRPNPLCPLPDIVSYMSTKGTEESVPGEMLACLHRAYREEDKGLRARVTPFCAAAGPHHDVGAAQASIDVLSTFDGMDNVFTALAHDPSLIGVVDLFPRSANQWMLKGWRERCLWRFLESLLGEKSDAAAQPARARI